MRAQKISGILYPAAYRHPLTWVRGGCPVQSQRKIIILQNHMFRSSDKVTCVPVNLAKFEDLLRKQATLDIDVTLTFPSRGVRGGSCVGGTLFFLVWHWRPLDTSPYIDTQIVRKVDARSFLYWKPVSYLFRPPDYSA